MLFRLLCLTLILPIAGLARGADQWRPPPWHLIDIWWDLGQDAPFESYSIDVTISDDVPDTTNLYIAPIGLGQLSGTNFYGGLQTQVDGYTARDPRLRKIGPGFLMSMWGQRSPQAIRPSMGGFWQSSGHEGDFVSVRRACPWKKGTYTYRVVRMDQETVEGEPRTWVGAFVYSHEGDEHIFVGALRFPKANLVLSRKIASFVEIYGPSIPVADIPKLSVTFGNLKINGMSVAEPTATAVYPKLVPDYARAEPRDGHVVVAIGEPVSRDPQRRVELLPPR